MKNKVSTYLFDSEMKDLLRQVDRRSLMGKRDYALLFLMMFTGLRRDEVCHLKRGNLKKEGKKVALYVRGKGDKERRIPIMNLDLIRSVQEYWAKTDLDADQALPFFCKIPDRVSPGIRPITWAVIRCVVSKYSKLAKIPKIIHPHSLRHSYASRLARAGVGIRTIQALMGHTDIGSTQVYMHTDEEQMEKAMAKMGL